MGRKEDMVALAEQLMSNQENIRNIGIVAHIDHGKCVHPETRLQLTNGNFVKAKELYQIASLQGIKAYEDNEKTVFALKKPIEIFSLNKKTGKIENKNISHAWKLSGGNLVKIKLKNNLSVSTTSEHKFLLFNGVEFQEKEANEIQKNDWVVCAKNWPFNPNETLNENNCANSTSTLLKQKQKFGKLAFAQVQEISNDFSEEVFDFTVPENHNFLAEGIFIHNTTMTDNLVAAAGIINPELAGKVQFMDYYALEQERGITINAANISLVHKIGGQKYLINVIDTPGHIDFGGEVIRAMRAVDGVIVVVDAVEGCMPQTETVIRQALKENVKPTLFINKVDRIVTEMRETLEQMQERFVKVIAQVNVLIKNNTPKEVKELWTVDVKNGSVCFGSAKGNWALSFDTMQKNNLKFKDVYDYCKDGKQAEFKKISPLHEAILGMVVKHLPNPKKAQVYRIPKIWKGDPESKAGKSMMLCDPNGTFSMMVSDVSVDLHAGDVATGRIYSGTLQRGLKIKLVGSKKEVLVQQAALYMGAERITLDRVPCGNIAALIGLKEVQAGETISDEEIPEFEAFMSNTVPVMTVSVEAKNPKDLPKLIEVIRQITKEDPNIQANINQETGEHLLSGMGELHLEVTEYRIKVDHKLDIIVGQPIVVYRETVTGSSPVIEGKSPNKHNKFKFSCEQIPNEILNKLIEAKFDERKVKTKDKELQLELQAMGFNKEESKSVWAIYGNNILINKTRGIQNLNETQELVVQGFKDAIDEGPQAKEKVMGVKVYLEDATLHEDAIHRGPAQVLPATTRPIYACMLLAKPALLEPKQILTINVPIDFMGAVTAQLQSRRTQIQEIRQEGDLSIIVGKAPVKELIGFSAAMRGATQGRAIWTAEYYGFEVMPREMQNTTLMDIRKRKGLPPELRKASDFMDD